MVDCRKCFAPRPCSREGDDVAWCDKFQPVNGLIWVGTFKGELDKNLLPFRVKRHITEVDMHVLKCEDCGGIFAIRDDPEKDWEEIHLWCPWC